MARPKSPTVDQEKLDSFLELFDDGPLDLGLTLRLADFARMKKNGELTPAAASFELLSIIVEYGDKGEANCEQIDRLFREKHPSVRIPLRILEPLAAGWKRYTSGETGRQLHEALRIGGSGQGDRFAERMNKSRQDFAAAFFIEFIRAQLAERGQDLSLEKTYAEYAEKSGVSASRLKRAYEARIDDVRAVNELLGFPIKPPE